MDSVDSGSSDDEITFGEWQFVDKGNELGSSDEESIEVIERELLAPEGVYPVSNTYYPEKRDHQKLNKNEVVDILGPDETVVTIMEKYDEPNIQKTQYTCHLCNAVANDKNATIMSWKQVHSFMLGVLVGVLIYQYKDYVFEKWSGFRFSPDSQLSSIYDKLVGTFSLRTQSGLTVVGKEILGGDGGNDQNFLSQFRKYIEDQKTSMDDKFIENVDVLKKSKRLKEDVYILHLFNLSKPVQVVQKMPKRLSELVKSVPINEIPSCQSNVTREQLPMVCEDNQEAMLLIEERQLMSALGLIKKFVGYSTNKLATFHDNFWNILTLPISSADMMKTDSGDFIPDCDSFSKQYKSTTYCMNSNKQCNVAKDESYATDDEKYKNFYSKFSWSEFAGSGKTSDGTSSNEKLVYKLKSLIMNFKEDFEHLYRFYINGEVNKSEKSEDSVRKNVEVDIENIDEVATANITEPKLSPKEDGRKKSISGEWFFNLSEARSKVRSYYEKFRERAKEKHRTFYDKYKKERGAKEPERNTRESSKSRKLSIKLKHFYKKVKNNVINNYKNFKGNVRRMFNDLYL